MSKNTEKPGRPAGGEYPVDPAERSNQEARLKKAAAAGASASRSPIPGLILQASPASPATEKAGEATEHSPKMPAPTQSAAEMTSERSASPIINDEVLAELRKISAWAEFQTKVTKRALTFMAFAILVGIGVVIFVTRDLNTKVESKMSVQTPDWSDVDRNVREGDPDKAILIGEELIAKTPQYWKSHERLANAYLAAGKVDKAKEHFATAFRLFPSEENEKLLSAIEKRIKTENP
jgi:tetratricopeptide (TPR) repeat protein